MSNADNPRRTGCDKFFNENIKIKSNSSDFNRIMLFMMSHHLMFTFNLSSFTYFICNTFLLHLLLNCQNQHLHNLLVFLTEPSVFWAELSEAKFAVFVISARIVHI